MKSLSIIFIVLLVAGCASTFATEQPPHIHFSDFETLEPLHVLPISPSVYMYFFKCKGTSLISLVYVYDGTVVRYCYLDQGELVGLQLDIELYVATGDVSYVPDAMSEDVVGWIMEMLNRMNRGLHPVLDEEESSTLVYGQAYDAV
jgi:hypothetical protein